MVGPKSRRAVVAWAQETYRVSERRACRALWARALVRYRIVKPGDAPLRGRLR